MNWNDYFKWCEKWLRDIYRVLKTDGRFCLNHYLSFGSGKRGYDIGKKKGTEQSDDGENGIRTSPLMDLNWIAVNKIGFKHHSIAIWQDITLSRKTAWGSWLSASSPYINSPFEGILFLYKNTWKKQKKGKTIIGKKEFVDLTRGVWKINTSPDSPTPATFPLSLPTKCISLLSYTGDLILDPFMGSGITIVSAKLLTRKAIGIEISKKYCNIAIKRLNKGSITHNLTPVSIKPDFIREDNNYNKKIVIKTKRLLPK